MYYKHYREFYDFISDPSVAVIAGSILMIFVSFFGMLGALRDNIKLLYVVSDVIMILELPLFSCLLLIYLTSKLMLWTSIILGKLLLPGKELKNGSVINCISQSVL